MKAVVQRVSSASVVVDGRIIGEVPSRSPGEAAVVASAGLLVLVGMVPDDGPADRDWLAEKLVHLRIFTDGQGKMNRSVVEIDGTVLLVPNFTLAGDARKGRRPSFDGAMKPELAEPAFAELVERVRELHPRVAAGHFRTHMRVELVNDGPVTILLDSKEALRAT